VAVANRDKPMELTPRGQRGGEAPHRLLGLRQVGPGERKHQDPARGELGRTPSVSTKRFGVAW
jgi:hypothetical protein